jgi:hypothetical protein
MRTRIIWSRTLLCLGSVAMLMGAVDPLEGSLVILPGSVLVALSAYLSQNRMWFRYWIWVCGLIALGVCAMVVLSWFGGLGGNSGRSILWGFLILPYPVGLLMGVVGLVLRLVERSKDHRQRVQKVW